MDLLSRGMHTNSEAINIHIYIFLDEDHSLHTNISRVISSKDQRAIVYVEISLKMLLHWLSRFMKLATVHVRSYHGQKFLHMIKYSQ